GPNHHGLDHGFPLHRAARVGLLDGRHDHIADVRVAATGAAEDADAQNFLGTAVVADEQSGFLLDHAASSSAGLAFVDLTGSSAFVAVSESSRRAGFSIIRLKRWCLRALIGRVSIISTLSPVAASFFSSCAMNFLLTVNCLRYRGWVLRVCTVTT